MDKFSRFARSIGKLNHHIKELKKLETRYTCQDCQQEVESFTMITAEQGIFYLKVVLCRHFIGGMLCYGSYRQPTIKEK